MEDEEIARKLENHEQRMIGAEHRIKDLESQQSKIQELVISVKEIAVNMSNMVAEQKAIREEQKRTVEKLDLLEDNTSKKLLELETSPDVENSKRMKAIKEKIVWLIIGGIVSYIFYSATGISL